MCFEKLYIENDCLGEISFAMSGSRISLYNISPRI